MAKKLVYNVVVIVFIFKSVSSIYTRDEITKEPFTKNWRKLAIQPEDLNQKHHNYDNSQITIHHNYSRVQTHGSAIGANQAPNHASNHGSTGHSPIQTVVVTETKQTTTFIPENQDRDTEVEQVWVQPQKLQQHTQNWEDQTQQWPEQTNFEVRDNLNWEETQNSGAHSKLNWEGTKTNNYRPKGHYIVQTGTTTDRNSPAQTKFEVRDNLNWAQTQTGVHNKLDWETKIESSSRAPKTLSNSEIEAQDKLMRLENAQNGAQNGAQTPGTNWQHTTNYGTSYRTNSGTSYGTNPGTSSGSYGTNYGTNPSTSYGTNPGTNPGTNSGTNWGTNSGTKPGTTQGTNPPSPTYKIEYRPKPAPVQDTKKYSNMAFENCPKNSTGPVAYIWSCSQFLNCYKGRTFIQNCAPGTYFNPETLECDYPFKVKCISGPRDQKVKSEKYSNEQICKPNFSGLLPHPTDCTKFINCAFGADYTQDCGPGTAFNSAIQACDYPEKVGCNINNKNELEVSEINNYLDDGFVPGGVPDGLSDRYTNYQLVKVYDKNIVQPRKHFCTGNCQPNYNQHGTNSELDQNLETGKTVHNCGPNCGPQHGQNTQQAHIYPGQNTAQHQVPVSGQNNCGPNCPSPNGQNLHQIPVHQQQRQTGHGCGQNCAHGQNTQNSENRGNGWNAGQTHTQGQNCHGTNCHGQIQPGIQQPCRSNCNPLGQNSGQIHHTQTGQNCRPCQGHNCINNCNNQNVPQNQNINLTATYWAGQSSYGQNTGQSSRAHTVQYPQNFDHTHSYRETSGQSLGQNSGHVGQNSGRNTGQNSGQTSRAHTVQTNFDQSSGSGQYYLHSRPNGQNTGRYTQTTSGQSGQQTRPNYGQNIQTQSSTVEAKCPPGHTGLLPHPYICAKFLNCANGGTFIQDCGPGTVFNPTTKVCDWPYNVKCTNVEPKREIGGQTGQNFGPSPTPTYTQNYGQNSTHSSGQNSGSGQYYIQTQRNITRYGQNYGPGQTGHQATGQNYGQNSGQHTGQYSGQNTGQYTGHTGQQSRQYTGQHTGQYTGENTGQHTGQNTGQYSGQNTGQYSGHNRGQYTGQHTTQHTSQHNNQQTGQNIGQHTVQTQNTNQNSGQHIIYSGQQTGQTSAQSYGQTVGQTTGQSTRQTIEQTTGQSSGQTTGQNAWQPSRQFTGQSTVQYTGQNTANNHQGTKTSPTYTRIIGYRRDPPHFAPPNSTTPYTRPIYNSTTSSTTKFSPIEVLEPLVLNSTIKVQPSPRKTGSHWPPPFPSTDTNADYYFEDLTEAPESKGGKKVWKNSNSCKEGEFECSFKECIPNIWVCDGEEDCRNGSDEKNCKMHLQKFNTIQNSRLYKHEVEKWLNTDLETCANYCLNSKTFTCKSFNFRKNENVCLLCDTNVGLSGALAHSYLYDYYEITAYAINCTSMYKCANSKCINYNQICDGIDDCGNRQDEKNCSAESIGYQIKLGGSPFKNEGRIEVKVFNEWGYICDDKFGLRNADVVCKELGFKEGALEIRAGSYFARDVKENETYYLMDDVQCIGNETTIRDCDFNGWGVHNCMPQEIVGVICKTPEESCPADHWKCDTTKECLPLQFLCDGVVDCFDKSDEGIQHCEAPIEVRLVNGTSRSEGRVEIRYHGVWGTICDDDFNDMTAKVVCGSLGFHGSAVAKKDGAFGGGIGPIWLDQVNCYGNESSVEDCTHWNWGEHNCEHSEDAGVVCSHMDTTQYEKKSKDKNIIDISPIKPNIDETIFKGKCGYTGDDLFTDENNQNSDIHFRVVKGSLARKGDYPWQATIRVKGKHKSSHWCGAVVISNKYVLTAAHCLVGFAKGSYIVRAGDYNVDEEEGTEVESFIEDFFVHERFRQGGHMNNDIALIKLKGSGLKLSKQVQPICLPNKDTKYKPGMNCTISGFGSTETGKSSSSRQLRAGWVTVQPQDTCKMPQVYGDAITEGMFCAGSLEEGVDSCDGDSGGPLACLDKGLFTLYGITSWGQRCGHVNKPGVYVKVAEYRDWIDRIIEETS